MNTAEMNSLNYDIDYWTARLETERAALKEMMEQDPTDAKELETKRKQVAKLEKAVLWRMRLRVKLAQQELEKFEEKTKAQFLRRSARIAARR